MEKLRKIIETPGRVNRIENEFKFSCLEYEAMFSMLNAEVDKLKEKVSAMEEVIEKLKNKAGVV